MASVKKGMLTSPREWWKHLRWTKRSFWKSERQAARRESHNDAAGLKDLFNQLEWDDTYDYKQERSRQ